MHFLALVIISIWLLTSNAFRSSFRLGALKKAGGGNRVLPYDKIVKQLKVHERTACCRAGLSVPKKRRICKD